TIRLNSRNFLTESRLRPKPLGACLAASGRLGIVLVRQKAKLQPSSRDRVRQPPPLVHDCISDNRSTAIQSRHGQELTAPASSLFCSWNKGDAQCVPENVK